jgi:hypothetical protein
MSIRRGSWRAAVALLLGIAAAPTSAAAATLYVATPVHGGIDAGPNSCLTAGSPCATIAHAVSVAANGDTISIGPGTFAGGMFVNNNLSFVGSGSGTLASFDPSKDTFIDESATTSAGLTLEAGGSVTGLRLSSGGGGGSPPFTSDSFALSLNAPPGGASYQVANDVLLQPSYTAGTHSLDDPALGVYGNGLATARIANVIVNGDYDGIDTSGNTAVTITRSFVQAANGGSAMYLAGGQTATVTDTTTSAAQGGYYGIQANGQVVNATRDTLVGNGAGAFVYAGGGDATINLRDTVAVDAPLTTGFGAGALVEVGNNHSGHLTAVNSTLVGYGKGVMAGLELQGSPGSTATATTANTIMWALDPTSPGTAKDVLATGATGGTTTFTAALSSFTTTSFTTGAIDTAPGSPGDLTGNPGFTNPAAGDFTLSASSPLIDVGDPAHVISGETDLHGNPRLDLSCPPAEIKPDIGAFEQGPTTAPLCAPTLSLVALTNTTPKPHRAKHHHHPKRVKFSARLSFTLGAPASLEGQIVQLLKGKRVKGHCTAIAHRKKSICPGSKASSHFTITGHQGANTDALPGAGHLRKGRYTLTLVAVNAAGRSATVSVKFRVAS